MESDLGKRSCASPGASSSLSAHGGQREEDTEMKRGFYLNVSLILSVLLLASACSNSKKDWQETETLNTVEAYEAFLQKHPSGSFADSARQGIEKLEWLQADLEPMTIHGRPTTASDATS
jgi:hypothetical protein